MIPSRNVSFVLTAILLAALGQSRAFGQQPEAVLEVKRQAQSTYGDIKATLGVVPEFMRAVPEEAITGAWQEMKKIQLSRDTAISPKNKELIGLAVASQIPCSYCVAFHTASARFNGASDQEIKEAVATAAVSRHWSALLEGADLNQKQFNKDIEKMGRRMESSPRAQAGTAAPGSIDRPMSRDSALKEIRAGLGFVPEFLSALPDDALAAAWSEYKGLYQSHSAEIPLKIRSLISLAVSAQVPSSFSVKMDRRFARAAKADARELKEAVAMAAVTRHWSAVLNGMQIDEQQFRGEMQQMFQHLRQKSPPAQQLGGEVPATGSSPSDDNSD